MINPACDPNSTVNIYQVVVVPVMEAEVKKNTQNTNFMTCSTEMKWMIDFSPVFLALYILSNIAPNGYVQPPPPMLDSNPPPQHHPMYTNGPPAPGPHGPPPPPLTGSPYANGSPSHQNASPQAGMAVPPPIQSKLSLQTIMSHSTLLFDYFSQEHLPPTWSSSQVLVHHHQCNTTILLLVMAASLKWTPRQSLPI